MKDNWMFSNNYNFSRPAHIGALLLAVFFLAASPAHSQVSGKAFDGFKKNGKDPVQISADNLQILDKKNIAIFKGRVKVLQGSSILTANKLTARYTKTKTGGRGDLKKLDFVGKVVVVSGKNTATADKGSYTIASQKVTLTGNVIISQGKDSVAKGCRLTANLKTNVANIHSCKGKRIKMIFTPKSSKTN